MADEPNPDDDSSGDTSRLGMILRYLRQPSTQQGLNVIIAWVATRFGLSLSDAVAIFGLVSGIILLLHDDRKRAKTVAEEVVRKVESTPIQVTTTPETGPPIDTTVQLTQTPKEETPDVKI